MWAVFEKSAFLIGFLVGFVIGVVIAYIVCKGLMSPNRIAHIQNQVAGFTAIQLGFFGTSLSILFSLSGSELVKDMKSVGNWNDLMEFMLNACAAAASVLVSGFLLSFCLPVSTDLTIDPDVSSFAVFMIVVWAATVGGALTSGVRLFSVFSTIVRAS